MDKPDLRPLAVSSLNVDPGIQRGLDRRRVSKMAEALDLDALGVVTVSHRANGTYHVVDGQHRIAAVRLAGGDSVKVMCRVFDGLSSEAEARLFRLLNNTVKPQQIDLFRIRVVEGDPVAVDIQRMIEANGWRLVFGTRPGAFVAVAAAERIYRLDPVALEKTFNVVTRAWGHAQSSVDGRVIEGIGLVLARYGTAVDVADLTDRLARYGGGAGALIGKARGLRDLRGGQICRALAEIVVDLYNARRKTRALPGWRAS